MSFWHGILGEVRAWGFGGDPDLMLASGKCFWVVVVVVVLVMVVVVVVWC